MENRPQSDQKTDIAEQAYRGPGAVITSLGYGVVDYKIASIASAALGLGIALAKPEATVKHLNNFAAKMHELRDANGVFRKSLGVAGVKFVELGQWFEKNVPFKHKLQSWVPQGKWEPVSRLTGMFATLGFFATFFTSAGRGIASANAGKNQLQDAQNEIKHLRKAVADQHTAAAEPAASTQHTENTEKPPPQLDAATIEHIGRTTPATGLERA